MAELASASPAVSVARARLDAISLARLAMAATAIVVSLPSAELYALTVRPSVVGAVVVAVVWATIAAMLVAARRQRIPPRWAPLLQSVLWLLVVGAVLTGVVVYREPHLFFIIALMIVSFGVMELDRRMVGAAFALAIAGCVGVAAATGTPVSGLHGLVFAAALAIGLLVNHSSYVFVVEAETQRAVAEHMRSIAEARSAELAVALAAAEREIDERERVEDERERMRDQFLAAQKMEALGTLAGGVAHDINNVLAGIMALAELSRDDASGAAKDDLDQIVASCQRGAALTRNLLAFSRRGQHRRGPVRVDAAVGSVVGLLERTIPKRIRLTAQLADDVTVAGDADQLTQAVVNLCLNAVDAIPDAGAITLFTRAADLDADAAAPLGLGPGRYAAITVHDTGVGMDDATRARMFEPFFTSKPVGKGTGLGLAMVYGTIEQHQGAIDVVTAPGAGTTVTLYVPVGAVAATTAAVVAAPVATSGHRILVVDDEDVVRTMTRRILERAGHEVEVADGGDRALALYRARPDFAAVVLDMAMPGMSGAQCFRALRGLDPGARVVLVSGFAEAADLRACLADGALGFVAKPFDRARLVAAVEAAATGQPVPALEGEA